MDFVQSLRTFVRVVDAGSFIRAADQLGTSNAAVTRQVAALERHLDVRLLNRTTRKLSLTSSGQVFIEKARGILADIEEAEGMARGKRAKVSGTLRLSVPLSFGIGQVSRLLPGFRARYPGLKLDIDLTDQIVDLVAQGVDVALRIAREPSPHLVARKLAPVVLVLCASPQYLKVRGVPGHPGDLAEHDTLSYSYLASGEAWTFTDARGEAIRVRINPSVNATNGEVLRELALAGGGVILQPSFIVGAELMRGTLVQVLPEWKTQELNLYAVYLSQRQLSAKVRAFIDYLVESIGDEPYWEQWKVSGDKGQRRRPSGATSGRRPIRQ